MKTSLVALAILCALGLCSSCKKDDNVLYVAYYLNIDHNILVAFDSSAVHSCYSLTDSANGCTTHYMEMWQRGYKVIAQLYVSLDEDFIIDRSDDLFAPDCDPSILVPYVHITIERPDNRTYESINSRVFYKRGVDTSTLEILSILLNAGMPSDSMEIQAKIYCLR